MKLQKGMIQMKEQDNPNEIELSNLPGKEFKVIITKFFTEFERRRMKTVRPSKRKYNYQT